MDPRKLVNPQTRRTLATQMHKVAAHVAQQDAALRLPENAQELTLKTAAYLIGVQAYRARREKQAMLDGAMNILKLQR